VKSILSATLSLVISVSTHAQQPKMYIVDDMVIDENQAAILASGNTRIEQKAELIYVAAEGYKAFFSKPWPRGIVPIRFAPGFTDREQLAVWGACAEWGQQAKIDCISYSDQKGYIYVNRNKGCSSLTGYGPGSRNLSLAPGCWDRHAILHEFGHALGFVHEHMRPDRDKYIQITIFSKGMPLSSTSLRAWATPALMIFIRLCTISAVNLARTARIQSFLLKAMRPMRRIWAGGIA
jgi:hypothetical protein